MAIYNERDLAIGLSGDISIAAGGDLELASAYETQKDQVNFYFRTNKGEYQPDRRVGCDVGEAIGESMTAEGLRAIEHTATAALAKFVLHRSDFRVDAIPLSVQEIGVFVTVGGQYLDEDGNLEVGDPEVLTYNFPFFDGDPTPF